MKNNRHQKLYELLKAFAQERHAAIYYRDFSDDFCAAPGQMRLLMRFHALKMRSVLAAMATLW